MSWNHTIRNKLKPVVKVWRAILCIVASLAQTSLGSETFSDGQVQMLMTSAARRGRLKGDDATMPSATVHHNTLSPQNSACPMVVRPLHAISVTSTSRVPYSSASEHTAPLQLYQTATSILWWLLQRHRRKTRMLRVNAKLR